MLCAQHYHAKLSVSVIQKVSDYISPLHKKVVDVVSSFPSDAKGTTVEGGIILLKIKNLTGNAAKVRMILSYRDLDNTFVSSCIDLIRSDIDSKEDI